MGARGCHRVTPYLTHGSRVAPLSGPESAGAVGDPGKDPSQMPAGSSSDREDAYPNVGPCSIQQAAIWIIPVGAWIGGIGALPTSSDVFAPI